jgi:hypothetical protein
MESSFCSPLLVIYSCKLYFSDFLDHFRWLYGEASRTMSWLQFIRFVLHLHVYINVYGFICIYMYVFAYICLYIYVCIDIYVHVYTYIYIYGEASRTMFWLQFIRSVLYMYIYMYIYVYMCICVCMYIYVYINTHMYV